jgi:hypothetical protein
MSPRYSHRLSSGAYWNPELRAYKDGRESANKMGRTIDGDLDDPSRDLLKKYLRAAGVYIHFLNVLGMVFAVERRC